MLSMCASLSALLIAFAAGLAAADDRTGTGAVAHTITILDGDVIRPSTLSMHSGDVLGSRDVRARTDALGTRGVITVQP